VSSILFGVFVGPVINKCDPEMKTLHWPKIILERQVSGEGVKEIYGGDEGKF
jgi:hypothetical protein